MWVRKVVKDLLTFKAATLPEKLWCYRRGFFSYRLRQYGLNEDNWRRWLSDRDYYWMRPINNQYEKWIADKVLFRYVAEPMHEYLPAHYFHLIPRGSEMGVMRLPDCPEGYEDNLEGVMALLRDKGALAMKKTTGLRGEGFYKLSCEGGQFAINGEPCSERAMRRHLRTRKDCYCLTEFLTMSSELKHMYVGAVDTLRLMVINRDGHSPRIMNAYLRIGTASSGVTDNISFGGVFCPVDLDTGRYHDAERSEGHMIVSCPVHPDTGSRIEGVIPRWEEIGRVVRDMCLLMPQLEYMGFDVTVTDQGVRVIEINRNQSLHRCPQYGEEIQTYFQQKIAYKQALCRARKNAAGRKGTK